MRIIVGAGGMTQDGWVPFEFDNLDIRDRRSWQWHFAPGTVDAVVSEHVLEHLYLAEAAAAARNVYEFLRRGGHWRIAVPDGYNPDPHYHEHSRPGGQYQTFCQPIFGEGPPHRVFYDVDSLTRLLTDAGFTIRPLEWHTRDGVLHRTNWKHADGFIKRSIGTEHISNMRLLLGFDNTSLIVDAIKRW